MSFTKNPVDMVFSSDDEFQDLEGTNVRVLECEGLPCRLWITKCMTLYNNDGILVGEGTCHNVNSNFMLGANDPLEDTHIAIHILRMHFEEDILHEQVYSLVAWPIKLVHCHGTSLHNHDARDNFNRIQATLLNPPSWTSARPYTSVIKNPPHKTSLKAKELLT